MLIFHIIAAVISVMYAAYLFISPSKVKLTVSYILTAVVIASGIYLTWSTAADITQSCLMGAGYLTLVVAIITMARQKLAHTIHQYTH